MAQINQLSSFMVLNIDGSDRVSFTFNTIDETGEIISRNNKKNFIVVDQKLASHINAIRKYIREQKLTDEE